MFSLKFVSAGKEFSTLKEMVPAPYMRRNFVVDEIPAAAKITICGLGLYELYLNGERLTKGLLAPYISNPDDILYYDEYDVTPLLKCGENTIGVILGNGMLNCPGGEIWDFQDVRYRSAPKLAFAYEAQMKDGSEVLFEADENVLCAPSAIYYDDLRIGEFYDARKEIEGWNLPGLSEDGWTAAIPAETPRGECRICEAEPIVTTMELAPVSVVKSSIGEKPDFRPNLPVIEPVGDEGGKEGWLYDFGVNAAGNISLKVKGRPGQKLVMQFGEELDKQGRLDLRSMIFLPEALNHRDIYICKGDEEEVYTPSFTYHGFRYCLVLGLDDEQATPELLTYLVMNTDLKSVGEFSCSDPILNKLQEITRTADLANFYYFPTDCPHREKNGWTADAALSTEQMMLNFTPEKSYREWLHNIRKAQRIDGALPGIIPTGGWGFAWGNGPAWDCIITELPYMIWKYRGDTEIIRENATAIVRYLNYVTTQRDADGLIHIGLGDWCQAARNGSGNYIAPLEVTDTLMCMDIAQKAVKMFDAVGLKIQKTFAESVYNEFRTAARKHLIDYCTMTVLGRCQTSQAMGIYYDLFEEGEKPAAFDVLLKLIEENDGLMDVGVVGARVLFNVLSRCGRTDLAYEMITTDRFPSYGGWVRAGATSLWEDFFPTDEYHGSRNHHFWGHISGWMFEHIAGIRFNPFADDVRRVDIQPRFVAALDDARAVYESPCGKISSDWKREGEDIVLTVAVPAECSGRIILETGWQFEDGYHVKKLTAGTYRIIPAHRRSTLYNG